MKDLILKFLSRSALRREPSPIRTISNYLLSLPPDKDVLSLAGGMPAPVTFPIDSVSVNLKSGETLNVRYNLVSGNSLLLSVDYGAL
jgi:hypothetical protein